MFFLQIFVYAWKHGDKLNLCFARLNAKTIKRVFSIYVCVYVQNRAVAITRDFENACIPLCVF